MLSRPFCNREEYEEGKGGEGSELSVNPDHSVLLCSSVRKRTHPRYEITHKQLAEEVFLSQSAQSSRRFLAHISSSQNAFGIQSSQSVTANVGTNKGQQVAYILLIGVSW